MCDRLRQLGLNQLKGDIEVKHRTYQTLQNVSDQITTFIKKEQLRRARTCEFGVLQM